MSVTPTPSEPVRPDSDSSGPVDSFPIDQLIADFRQWLATLPRQLPNVTETPKRTVDLASLLGQMIALKQEINLQTRATRSSLEQNAESLKQLSELTQRLKAVAETETSNGTKESIKPLLKGVIDAYDSLSLAHREVSKLRQSLDEALVELQDLIVVAELPRVSETIPSPAEAVGFWAKLFGRAKQIPPEENPLFAERQALDEWRAKLIEQVENRQQAVEEVATRLDGTFESLLTGYEMSMARIDKCLKRMGLEPIPTEDARFDAETMEVIEVVRDSGLPTNSIIEAVKRGYRWNGILFRAAQVKVAK